MLFPKAVVLNHGKLVLKTLGTLLWRTCHWVIFVQFWCRLHVEIRYKISGLQLKWHLKQFLQDCMLFVYFSSSWKVYLLWTGTPEREEMTGHFPLTFHSNGGREEVPFHNNSNIGHFMIYKNRLETNLLHLFAFPENSKWFSIIFVIVFEVNILAERK